MIGLGSVIFIGFLIILLCLLVGPFLIPIPTLENTVPPEELAEQGSRFETIDDVRCTIRLQAVVIMPSYSYTDLERAPLPGIRL